MNSVNLVGRLVKKPTLTSTEKGNLISRYSIVINSKTIDKQERVSYINCVSFKNSAEYLNKYAEKGMRLAITGSLVQEEFLSKEGLHIKRLFVYTKNVEILFDKKTDEERAESIDNNLDMSGEELPF